MERMKEEINKNIAEEKLSLEALLKKQQEEKDKNKVKTQKEDKVKQEKNKLL